MRDPAFQPHDHARCRARLLAYARQRAARDGLRLTPVRALVLEILARDHRPLGAYEVLDRLMAHGYANQPPIAYRALEFLCAKGLAHRIERLSAFTACRFPGRPHVPSFLICRRCGYVAETASPVLNDAVTRLASGAGFVADPAGVEVTGICPPCGEDAPTDRDLPRDATGETRAANPARAVT